MTSQIWEPLPYKISEREGDQEVHIVLLANLKRGKTRLVVHRLGYMLMQPCEPCDNGRKYDGEIFFNLPL